MDVSAYVQLTAFHRYAPRATVLPGQCPLAERDPKNGA